MDPREKSKGWTKWGLPSESVQFLFVLWEEGRWEGFTFRIFKVWIAIVAWAWCPTFLSSIWGCHEGSGSVCGAQSLGMPGVDGTVVGPGSQGSLPQRGTRGLCTLHWLRPGRALETSQATATEMCPTTTPGLLMCPSCRGLPSQAFEYILYNKGIMGEDTYPYRGRVTMGGRSCVPSHLHFTLIPPPPCCHSNLTSSWCRLYPLLLPRASCHSCLCNTVCLS